MGKKDVPHELLRQPSDRDGEYTSPFEIYG